MDSRLTDLDSLVLTVRNPLSRSYIDEAVRAYRAGSYKASIVSIWVAVTFDILSKIRELSDDNDAAAMAFITNFDANVAANNISKLLEIEGRLLDDAERTFAFLDSISRMQFERLKQDRNLCAHPAFDSEGSLFIPEPELVRLYLVEAVRNLLSQRPVQGKTIIRLFDRDFKGPSFPTGREEIPRFVENRYLANSRKVVLASFAQVLAKALLQASPQGWEAKLSLIPFALEAVKTHDAEIWVTRVLPDLVARVDSCADDNLPNVFPLLISFPDLRAALPMPAIERLRAYIQNFDPEAGDYRSFEAAAIDEFEDDVVVRFEDCSRSTQAAVLLQFPLPAFWDEAMSRLATASSFRGAEALFTEFAMPFQWIATAQQLGELLQVIIDNGQIAHASGIPTPLAAFAQAVGDHHPIPLAEVTPFIQYLDEKSRRPAFAELLEVLQEAGVAIPTPPEDPEAGA